MPLDDLRLSNLQRRFTIYLKYAETLISHPIFSLPYIVLIASMFLLSLEDHKYFCYLTSPHLIWRTDQFHFFITFEQINIFTLNYTKIDTPVPDQQE